jgi:hypothetical protein
MPNKTTALPNRQRSPRPKTRQLEWRENCSDSAIVSLEGWYLRATHPLVITYKMVNGRLGKSSGRRIIDTPIAAMPMTPSFRVFEAAVCFWSVLKLAHRK